MNIISLQSGSSGNCIYVETDGVRLLFDAGISGTQARDRLSATGRDIRDANALLISHDHIDHSACAGIYQRKFGLPVYATSRTLRRAGKIRDLGPMPDVRHFHAGETVRFGNVTVETIPTPHDGVDGVAFVIDDGRKRLGIFTDLGHVFSDLKSALAGVDAAVLESNHDLEMLANGPYPYSLKRRIRGPGGHISNIEAAELVACSAGSRLRWVCLAHLSAENNTPELALSTHRDVLGSGLILHIAGRYEATSVLTV